MKSETMNTTLIRFSAVNRCRTAGSSAVGPGRGDNAQHRSSTLHAAARVRRGGWYSSTRSENARNPVLIWSDTAENSSEPVMNVISSFFDRWAAPSSIERETSMAIITFSSRSACVWRTYGAPIRAVTFQSIRRTSSPCR